MKIYKILLPLLLVALFLLTSCGEDEQQQDTESAFIGGTSGITASFEPLSVEEDGVYTVFDTEDFPLDIILKNQGEEDLAPGMANLRLLGPAKEDFKNIPKWQLSNQGEIEKISEFNPEGGEEIISFTPNNRALYGGEVTGFTDVTWNLEYWYDYKTHLIVNDVCFKGDITDTKVCEVKEDKTYSVSGAPITVTKVSEDAGGKGIIILRIEIQNIGSGDSTVVGSEFDKRFDQISYTIDEPEKWECKSGGREGEARMMENTAQIICRLKNPLTDDDIYTKPVRLTLEYTYKELIQEKLRIKESAG